MLTQWMGGSEKVKNYADVIYERPLGRTHYWPRFFTAIKSHNTSRQELLKPLRHIFRDRSRHYQFFVSLFNVMYKHFWPVTAAAAVKLDKTEQKASDNLHPFWHSTLYFERKKKYFVLHTYLCSLFHQIKLSKLSA